MGRSPEVCEKEEEEGQGKDGELGGEGEEAVRRKGKEFQPQV